MATWSTDCATEAYPVLECPSLGAEIPTRDADTEEASEGGAELALWNVLDQDNVSCVGINSYWLVRRWTLQEIVMGRIRRTELAGRREKDAPTWTLLQGWHSCVA